MVWINWEVFTKGWLQRAERRKVSVDDGDRFISLWIAFNGWLSGKFGEGEIDANKIKSVKKMQDFKEVFNHLRETDIAFKKSLDKLEGMPIAIMQVRKNREQIYKYDGTFESLIEAIYRVRCNLFHGRKDITEDKKDKELVKLAYRILLPLFKAYLSANPS